MARSIDNFITMPPGTVSSKNNSNRRHSRDKLVKNKKCMVEPTNFDFEPYKKPEKKTIDIARIHSKLTTKRVGGQVMLVPQK